MTDIVDEMNDSDKLGQIKSWLGSGSLNLFGLPFAGKNTQGQRLANIFDAPLLGSGDILRSSEMPKHIKKLHGTGKLFPTDLYLKLVLPYLSQREFVGKPLILSSFGRWHGEEAGVLEAISAAGHPLKAVVFLKIDEETVWKRWSEADLEKDRGSRDDDSYETLQVRLDEFREKTVPVIQFYKENNLLIELDGNNETDVMTKTILDALYDYAKNAQV